MEFDIIALVIVMSAVGSSIGMLSGLVPGIHVNTLASLMLVFYPSIASLMLLFADPSYVPVLLSACIVSASVVHSFVSYVPSVFTGVPDQDTVMSVLPGHRLLLDGKGMKAVRSAAIGSLIGAVSAVAVAVPLQYLMAGGLADILRMITIPMLAMAVTALVLGERTLKGRCFAAALIFISGIMGCICMFMPVPYSGLLSGGDLLFPLLTGLFGIPMLISSAGGAEIPPQTDDDRYPVAPSSGLKGVLTGSVVGWFPGITATAGAAFTRMFVKEDRPERFIALVSSIGTAGTVFALITLSVSGKGRTGTMVAVREIIGDGMSGVANWMFMLMLLSVAIASLIGYWATIRSGKAMSKFITKVNVKKMNAAIVVIIITLTALMTGVWGIGILLISSIVGLIPISAGIGRVHLSGCLLIPVVLMQFGLDTAFLSLF
ncbi:MAG: tripartite tricarboxylate transporter permease [Methanomassiliicoccaceae archaeon]|nr:tripartite tricarboxylate transporter permease [Methanomassiliicoccaceae archaeon]